MKIFSKESELREGKYYNVFNVFGLKISHIDYKKTITLLSKKIDGLNNLLYEVNDPNLDLKFPIVKSIDETLSELINTEKSLARYGDGEFSIIKDGFVGFQESNPKLAERLKQILSEDNPNLMCCIIDVFGNLLSGRSEKSLVHLRHLMATHRKDIYSCLNFNKIYYNAIVSRLPFDSSLASARVKLLKKIWDKKKVILVEGLGTRMGVGNDLLDNCTEIKRILCPSTNAFDKYDEILAECCKHSKDYLFMIALGPTATVLASDLSKIGYRALDIGHLDMTYEWHKMGATKKVPLKNKNVNEAGNNNITDVYDDDDFKNQILAVIS